MRPLQELHPALKNITNYWQVKEVLKEFGFRSAASCGKLYYFENGYDEDSLTFILCTDEKDSVKNNDEVVMDIIDKDSDWNWVVTNKNRFKRHDEKKFINTLEQLQNIKSFDELKNILIHLDSKCYRVLDLVQVGLPNKKTLVCCLNEHTKQLIQKISEIYKTEYKSPENFWVIFNQAL